MCSDPDSGGIEDADFADTDMGGDSSNDGEGREETTAEAAAEKADASEQADGGSRR